MSFSNLLNRKGLFFLLAFSTLISTVNARKSNSSFVNLFIGTAGDNGQVDPGAAVPFGMVRVCPDSDPRSHSGYDYNIDKISGISVNRMSGVGCSGAGGNLSIKPAESIFELRKIKQTEHAVPGFYQVEFNNGVKTECTATHNIAVERYQFPKGVEALFTVNFGASFERILSEQHKVVGNNEIEGFVESVNVCGHGKYKLYFNLRTNRPFTVKTDANQQMVLLFENTQKVEIRIALSSVDVLTARKENLLVKCQRFEQLKSKAAHLWKRKLSKIKVEGGTANEKTIFYTSLYRVYLSPANVTSTDGSYLATDGKVHNSNGISYYSSWSLWDTYRTKFPLLVLMEPEAMSHMAQSLVRLYQTGKSNWSTNYEATPSVRTEHAVILLLDAFQKGVKNIDFRACYPQLCKEASELLLDSPDHKLESATDLWALAQIADIIGETRDAKKYSQQSEDLFSSTWKQEFMKIDTTFTKMGGNGLYQGTRWQYRWAVPQYLDKMIEWVGSQEMLRNQLHYFFEQHLFNQGNEPDIHVPYLFNRLGAPEETQRCVHALMCDEIIHKYGGNAEFPKPYFGRAFKNGTEGYMPEMDEDDGTMGAWYVFSAMGFYPLVLGHSEYDFTSPVFDRISLRLDNGKTFTIKAKNRESITDIVKSKALNGKPYPAWQLSHQQMLQGGVLEFEY